MNHLSLLSAEELGDLTLRQLCTLHKTSPVVVVGGGVLLPDTYVGFNADTATSEAAVEDNRSPTIAVRFGMGSRERFTELAQGLQTLTLQEWVQPDPNQTTLELTD